MKERQMIEQIRSLVGSGSADLLQGIGDDCAVISKDGDTAWLVSMDTLLESVHFNRDWHPPELLGQKAVAVNVSDIAAMGGKPTFILLSLGLPADFSQKWLNLFNRGISKACQQYGCLLIGGDTVCSPDRVNLSLTIIGEMAANRVLYRNRAEIGDTIWVSGSLGLSAAGLALLQAGYSPDPAAAPELEPFFAAHLNPQPQVRLGQELAASNLVHAMMDLSDGLATDLSHICAASRVGAEVVAEQLPGHARLAAPATLLDRKPLAWMVAGGEDYELLFTASPAAEENLLRLAESCQRRIQPVGTIVQGRDITLVQSNDKTGRNTGRNISFQGFDHFSP